MNYLDLATNPKQYDSPELDWRDMGNQDSPSRQYFRKHLQPVLGDLNGKKVLDIGCGVGAILSMLKEQGAEEIDCFDPSSRNVACVKEKYPYVTVSESTLESYTPTNQYDVCIALMIFEHIRDIKRAFQKINSFLKDNGYFYLVVGSFGYHTMPRPSVISFDVQKLENGVVATKTIRPAGTMYDIFRPLEQIQADAKSGGFTLVDHKESPELVHAGPSEPVTACHLLVLKKLSL